MYAGLFFIFCLGHKNDIQKRQKTFYEFEAGSILNEVRNYRNEKSWLFTGTYFFGIENILGYLLLLITRRIYHSGR